MKSGSTQRVASQRIWEIIIQNSNAWSERNLERDREERWGWHCDVRVKGKCRSAFNFASAMISLCRRSRFFFLNFLIFTMVMMNSWGSTYQSCLIPQGMEGRCFQDDWLMWEVGLWWVNTQCNRVHRKCLWYKGIKFQPCNKERGWWQQLQLHWLIHQYATLWMWVWNGFSFCWTQSLSWSEQSAELNLTLEIYLSILSVANLRKWRSVPVPGGLQCPSGIARQPLGLQGGTVWGILQGNLDYVFSLSSFGVDPCIWCSFPIMCRTELIFQSVPAAPLHSCRSLELLHIQRCSS